MSKKEIIKTPEQKAQELKAKTDMLKATMDFINNKSQLVQEATISQLSKDARKDSQQKAIQFLQELEAEYNQQEGQLNEHLDSVSPTYQTTSSPTTEAIIQELSDKLEKIKQTIAFTTNTGKDARYLTTSPDYKKQIEQDQTKILTFLDGIKAETTIKLDEYKKRKQK